MRKQIARFLLLFAIAGNFVPVALAATASQPHACCLRKTPHQCHGSAAVSFEHAIVQSNGCCNHDCCRAASISHQANPLLGDFAGRSSNVTVGSVETGSNKCTSDVLTSHSNRGPPSSLLS